MNELRRTWSTSPARAHGWLGLAVGAVATVACLRAQATWVRRSPAAAPPPRAFHDLAFDSGRGRVVLFGGGDASFANPRADTWEMR
jgi:hypothetical protein